MPLRKLLLIDKHVCPWWLAYTFDNPIRRLFHKPEKIFSPYLQERMTAVDIGCGMGYFSIGLAKIVGEKGSVISVDLQQKMLDVLENRAKRAGVVHRIRLHRCEADNIGLDVEADFVLTFWMAHETPNPQELMKQVYAILKPQGKYFLAEPRGHVSSDRFREISECATQADFKVFDRPQITFSRAVVFEK